MWKLAWSCLVSDWDACNIDLMIIVKLPFQFKKKKNHNIINENKKYNKNKERWPRDGKTNA